MKYKKIREEELKNKVANDWFIDFDTTEILGNIDFTVFPKQAILFERTPLLWAEAKTGDFDVSAMFVQLILTIGKARTFDKTMPPAFLGAFDFKKIAFIPYINIQDIFFLNDFNWNVTPSNHDSKEFKLIKNRIEKTLKQQTYTFNYLKDEKELNTFIKKNVAKATNKSKIKIDKNNFIPIYLRWLETVKPIIDVNWDDLKKENIFDNDFYLADLFVDDKGTQDIDDDITIRDNLFVVFKNQGYTIAKEDIKQMFDATINIRHKETYQKFWKIYKRPPLKEYQDYIIERRDLLVPQDIRERKGAYFTPRKWVELSQKYITDYLGKDWQDDYYIWDCAAGTGNLLAGLNNKYNIYASTLDQADVNVIHERIEQGANLLKKHVFQFDFLNDDFSKLPKSLQDIINDENKRKKLIIYINPPYAEHGNRKTFAGEGTHKKSVATTSKIYNNLSKTVGTATRELFVQFFLRVHDEIPECTLASFSTLKYINSQNFLKFRKYFKGTNESGFICQSNTFDNVKGKFPIGFLIWNLSNKQEIKVAKTDILNDFGEYTGSKYFYSFEKKDFISTWLRKYYDKENEILAYLILPGIDMQQQNGVYFTSKPTSSDIKQHKTTIITKNNLTIMAIYLAIRQVIKPNWTNNRDQFLFPNNHWEKDIEFQNDCLAFTLFHGQNKISSNEKINNWIPFTEQEVDANEKFASNFMTDFIKGKIKIESEKEIKLFAIDKNENIKREFSEEATAVFDAGRKLWKYYHSKENVNVNASFYDIREYFQGRSDKGRMNSKSTDAIYTELISELRECLKILAKKIEPKIYEYEFLKG
ncbi:hypothetical protein [Tenacibaculum finnmarkense]|uniref:hypothetical protein n=1 Tax=Tenacibaculum finnmarkense TaxID=2781243 RepID=UPI000C492C1F|nr:hypothetical protein [Tenacibaculum finnmarkense]MCG8775057.1 hypothetical protein [Tenacibaculum finnmarkense]MCG8872150.1 hypothetical protein [Tenacibaculum finnmarkense]SOS50072.1 Modification methylase HindII [Tenacibaculum finnmarkense]